MKRNQRCNYCLPHLAKGNHEKFRLFSEGDDLYNDMLSHISSAKHYVWLESYIFADDTIGQKFAAALAERAQAGLDVRLHIDAAGSLFWVSRKLENELKKQGVWVRWFHRWLWRKPFRYNKRNHRKLLVVDGETAFLGGANIHSENSLAEFGEQRWRDCHVKFHGPLAHTASELFRHFWNGNRYWMPKVSNSATSIILPNQNKNCREILRCVFSNVFRDAKNSIYLTTPYFVPDNRTQNELVKAAQKGIDVRLLVPQKSDVPLVRWAAQAAYFKLLQGGVKIYEYMPRVLHAKTAIVDENWAMLGTANLDYRSLFINYELNLVTKHNDLCSELKKQFFNDLSQSRFIGLELWNKRPLINRFYETLGWVARRWL